MWSDTDSDTNEGEDYLDTLLASFDNIRNQDFANCNFNDIFDEPNQNMSFFETLLPESEVSTNQSEISNFIKRTVMLNLLKENYLKKFLNYTSEIQSKVKNYTKKLIEELKSIDDNSNNIDDVNEMKFKFEGNHYGGYNITNDITKYKKQKIDIIENLFNESKPNSDNNKFNCTIYNFGIPYFKDESNHSFRKNIERVRMDENGILMPFYFEKPSQWQQSHFTQLKRAVLTFMPFKKKKKSNDTSIWSFYNAEEHDKLIDWDKISEHVFNNHMKSSECESLWTIYLNPSINKSNWTNDEKEKLLELIELNSYQNWKVIANDLGTNRSAYQCFLFYVQKSKTFFFEDYFNVEEDKKLLGLIKQSQLGSFISWPKVFYYFNTRSRLQLFYRYTQTLHKVCENLSSKNNMEILSIDSSSTSRERKKFTTKRQVFTISEDFLLINLIEKHGPKSWTMFAKDYFHDKRTADQLRHRYNFLTGRYSKKIKRSTKDQMLMKKYIEEEIHRKEPVPNGNQIIIPEKQNIFRLKRGRKPGKLKRDDRLDKELVAFFNGNFTFAGRPRKWAANDYLKSITKLLQFFNIKTLNLCIDLNMNDKINHELSLEDEIIELLREQGHEQYQEVDSNEIKNSALPLNISNLVGLRYMLRQTKFAIGKKQELPNSLINNLAFQRFNDRFKRLFFLAAISSLEWEDPDFSNEHDGFNTNKKVRGGLEL